MCSGFQSFSLWTKVLLDFSVFFSHQQTIKRVRRKMDKIVVAELTYILKGGITLRNDVSDFF